MNLSRGTMMRLPRVMVGKSLRCTTSYAWARPIPSTWDTSSTVSISGSSSNELYLDFLIQFLSTFRPEGFYSLFCGAVSAPLTWSDRATAPHGRPACDPRSCAFLGASSAASGRSGYHWGATWERSYPGSPSSRKPRFGILLAHRTD